VIALPEVNDDFFVDVKGQIVVVAPYSQVDFPPIGSSNISHFFSIFAIGPKVFIQ